MSWLKGEVASRVISIAENLINNLLSLAEEREKLLKRTLELIDMNLALAQENRLLREKLNEKEVEYEAFNE